MTHTSRFLSIISLCIIFTSCKLPTGTAQVKDLTTFKDFQEEVLNTQAKRGTSQITVVDVYTSWCGPCKQMKPIFAKLSTEFENITFVAVDAGKVKEVMSSFNITSVPTFLFFKDGKELTSKRISGSRSETAFRTLLQDLNPQKETSLLINDLQNKVAAVKAAQ